VNGSGDITEVEYSFENFTKVDVSNAFKLTVIPSDTYKVVLNVDDNIVKYLDVYKNGDWLIIGLDDDKNYNNLHLEAEVHLPVVTALEGSGASVITINGFESNEDFDLELSGASVLSGNIEARNCNIELSGASVISLSGSCNQLDLYVSGASVLSLGNFVCSKAEVHLSGASDATIHVTDYLSATLSGASILRYYGDPEIGYLNISGASVITKL